MLPLVSGQNFIFDYPDSINYGEEFQASIKIDNLTGIFDVKIDIIANNTRLSEIYDNEWKSSYYYIKNAIDSSVNNEAFFLINITKKYSGKANINISLRQKSKYFRENYEVMIIDIKPDDKSNLIKDYEIEEENITKDIPEEKNGEIKKTIEENLTREEVIMLNKPKNIKSPLIWKSRTEYIKEYAIYAFILLCILLIIKTKK